MRACALVGVIVAMLLAMTNARADVATITTDNSGGFATETAAVAINDRLVCTACTFYLAPDRQIYLSERDVDAWGLKRPRFSSRPDSLERYALVDDLNLAGSYDADARRLHIIAPANAFRGAAPARTEVAPGSGTFLNYDVRRESGRYALYSGSTRGGVFETSYVSSAGENGLEFHRGTTRWSRTSNESHTVVSIGDGATNGIGVGTGIPFFGVEYASDLLSDPEYVPRTPPVLRGIATEPSLLEVYVNNILELRRDVPVGAFLVDDLPPAAAIGDVLMVLTDATGKKSTRSRVPISITRCSRVVMHPSSSTPD